MVLFEVLMVNDCQLLTYKAIGKIHYNFHWQISF